MHDAGRTREDDPDTLCDHCGEDSDTCGRTLMDCLEIREGDRVDAAYEAWRDRE